MEPEISPLAKRLAEENNVNWRGLNGSGADGKILERDVLEYLARVMAGEEDLNPTAEPVPEGMEAWPEQDVQGFFGDSEAASAGASAEADLADDVLFDTGAAAEDIKDDMFLFGEDEAAETPAPFTAQAADSPVDTGTSPMLDMNVDADALVNGSVDGSADAVPSFETSAEPPADLTFQDSSLQDSTLQESTLQQPALQDHTFSSPAAEGKMPAVSASAEGFGEDVDDLEFDEDVAALFVDDVAEAPTPSFEADRFNAGGAPPAQEDLLDHVIPPAPADVPTTPFTGAAAAAGATAVHEAVTREETVTREEIVPEVAPAQEAPAQESVQEPSAPVAETLSEPETTPANAPFVSYGTLLRRHIDLSQTVQAQTDIAKELGQDESSVLSALVLRAVAKASQSSPLGGAGQFGVADVSGGGISLAAVDNILSQGFTSLVTDVQNAPASSADALALVVVDMSSSGVDEAVLNIDVPVLTVGRTLFDSTEGTHRSTLSLSGDISVEAGSKFLAAVSELLDTPVRLVL